jgi:hypothetical protein
MSIDFRITFSIVWDILERATWSRLATTSKHNFGVGRWTPSFASPSLSHFSIWHQPFISVTANLHTWLCSPSQIWSSEYCRVWRITLIIIELCLEVYYTVTKIWKCDRDWSRISSIIQLEIPRSSNFPSSTREPSRQQASPHLLP